MKPYLKYTFGLVRRQKKNAITLVVLRLLDAASRLVQPYIYKLVVDVLTVGITAGGFVAGQTEYLMKVLIFWFAVAVFYNVVNAQSHYLTWKIGSVASHEVHVEGYKRLLRLDYHAHTKKHSSKYAKIVDDADTGVWEMTQWWLARFFPSILGFIGMLAIAFSVSWQMTLMSLAVIPFGLAMIFTMIKKCEDEQRRVNKMWNLKHEHLSDQVANIITYKLNQDEKLFVDVQDGYSLKAHLAQQALNKNWRLTEMLNPDVIARFAVMAMGIWMVMNGGITLGTLFMFMGLMSEILVPLHVLGDILPQYSRRARYIERYLDLAKQEDSVKDPVKPREIGVVKGRIVFENVAFNYAHGEDSFGLKDVNFTIEPGEHIAMVGHSGAGKSTIMALLTRLADPTSGRILLDGVDIRDYRQADYRALIGTVLQEHSLYNETIAQNIAYGRPGATQKEIEEAAKKAAAHYYIEKLPQGYDTMIGERGVRLSGGEKQRLAIARAILKDPKIVVLDEPTSALDSITEAKVQKGLEALIEGRTAVTIAHRLSTVRNADKIIVLKEGMIAAMGTHSELLRSYPEYREMVELQTGGFLEDE
jgi:ABC-type multidrug transport system fused ATPase/permease subunit